MFPCPPKSQVLSNKKPNRDSSLKSSITGRGLPPRSSIVQLSGDPLQYLEKTLTMLEDKIMRLGIGLQEYYCVCAIIGLIKRPPGSAEQSRDEQMRSADRVATMIQRVLAAQDNYSAAATLASLPNMVLTLLHLFYALPLTTLELTFSPPSI